MNNRNWDYIALHEVVGGIDVGLQSPYHMVVARDGALALPPLPELRSDREAVEYFNRCLVKNGEKTNDLFANLTTEANGDVKSIHPKAMPVILTKPGAFETWLTGSAQEALKLQRPLPDASLKIVARGPKEEPPATT